MLEYPSLYFFGRNSSKLCVYIRTELFDTSMYSAKRLCSFTPPHCEIVVLAQGLIAASAPAISLVVSLIRDVFR